MSGQTHYDVLGVAPSARPDEIRDAYRRLAREHHPDRAASNGRFDREASMPAINEAYRVLNDPARRAVYDASLRNGGATPLRGPAAPPGAGSSVHTHTPASTMPTFPSHLGPARIPWRSVLFVASLAIVGIIVLAQFTEPGEPRGPDGIIQIGSCVTIEPNGDAREVSCTQDPTLDLVVEAFVPFEDACPGATVAHRDRQGMGIACVGVSVDAGG
ncbi:MAG TPA: J domain-containing protein [Ilumatobacteraceae bacterium]|nr:J domain-containing protein [Ilumatobacteraceae bacterium]